MEEYFISERSLGIASAHGDALLIIGWCLFGASTLFVGLRTYARHTRSGGVNTSDWLMITAWALEAIHMIFASVCYAHGLGEHFVELSPEEKSHAMFYIVAFLELFAITPCMFARISFAVFLLMIIGLTSKVKKSFLWIVIGVQIVMNLVVLIQIYAQCGNDFDAIWNLEVAAHAHCQSPMVETILGYVQSGFNSVCDLILTTIPAFVIWDLKMPRRQKMVLACILMLSIFAFAASVVKAIQIKNLSATGDFTWYMTDLQLWVCVENNVVMMAASTPALKPLMTMRKGDQRTASDYHYNYNYTDNSYELKKSHPWSRMGRNRNEKSQRSDIDTRKYGFTNSEEHILQPPDPALITKTTEVEVSYNSREQAGRSFESQPGQVPRFDMGLV